MLCAGVADGAKDASPGDSGWLLLTASGVQVGITSYGNGRIFRQQIAFIKLKESCNSQLIVPLCTK